MTTFFQVVFGFAIVYGVIATILLLGFGVDIVSWWQPVNHDYY